MAAISSAAPFVDRRRTPRTKEVGEPLTIALVNNMPDAALAATERQFTNLVRTAVGRQPHRLRVYSSTRIARGPDASRHVKALHNPLDALLAGRADAVIVTGNEPREQRLDREPYWDDIRRLVDWTQTNARASLWSCLAAHAAVLHLDGIDRTPLPEKLSGLFESTVTREEPLLDHIGGRIATPHSRYNTVREVDLVARGYRVLTRSDLAGVDMFARDFGGTFLFLQGHPEYDTDTLLREYRRDVGRFLRGDSETYPKEPVGYFNAEATAILHAFRRRALAHRHLELFEVFPNVAVPFAITNRWHEWTVKLFRNWLSLATPEPRRIGA